MIQIVRTFWGTQESTWGEVPTKPLFEKETVFVWGTENEKRFKELGYKTVLMGVDSSRFEYSNIFDHFAHKLDALQKAESMYKEYLFLDWDVHIVKTLDDNFWETIRSGNNIQCPIYGYPIEYEKKILQHLKDNPQKEWVQNLDPNTFPWIKVQDFLLKKYHWQWEDLQLVPNFCFVYSNNTKLATELLHIYNKYGIKTCIEEYCMYIFANCSVEEFILKYEPSVIRGREDDCYHFDLEEDDTMRRINRLVGSIKPKNIYLKHI
jgi:hypothetical protein